MATRTFEKIANGISDRLHEASGRIVDFKDDSARDLGRRVDKLGALMKKHPLLAIGIGVGVGIAAGFLVARISDR